MGWERFRGNSAIVASVRRMIRSRRLPHSLALAGPPGVGKHTMATMVARTINCLDKTAYERADFCGECWNCKAIAELETYEDHPELGKIVAERPRLSLQERKENPLLLSTHPDIFVLPPDGKAQQISIHQVRRMIALAQYRPSRARQRVFILDNVDRTDEVANQRHAENPGRAAGRYSAAADCSLLLPAAPDGAVAGLSPASGAARKRGSGAAAGGAAVEPGRETAGGPALRGQPRDCPPNGSGGIAAPARRTAGAAPRRARKPQLRRLVRAHTKPGASPGRKT